MEKLQKIKHMISDIFRPVLSDKTIVEYNKKGLLIEGGLDKSQIQPNSIDLRLGNTWKKLKPNSFIGDKPSIDTRQEISYDEGKFESGVGFNYDTEKLSMIPRYYTLQPGEFVLMASEEVLNIPNGILSFVQGRSSIARLAVQTEQAGLIDAGFRGTITFEVKNEGEYPIRLYEGMRVAQVYFFKAQHALHPYGSKDKGSKYQLQMDPTGSKIHLDRELQH